MRIIPAFLVGAALFAATPSFAHSPSSQKGNADVLAMEEGSPRGEELEMNAKRGEGSRAVREGMAEISSQRAWEFILAACLAAYVLVTFLTFGLITLKRSRNEVRRANDKLEITNRALEVALKEVKERAEAERRANILAEHDTLTGLGNRRHLQERLTEWMEKAKGTRSAAMLLDLDRFKAVNDLNGHHTGDKVLIEVARRLKNLDFGGDAFIVRLGGDEFIIMLIGDQDVETTERIARETLEAISHPFEIDERRHQLGTSIGIARFPEDADDVEELMRAADIAMYEAKRSGRNAYRFYDVELDRRVRKRARIEDDLRDAVEVEGIEAWFQPIVRIETEEVTGFEALARWPHPELGMIPPDEFIPIAEEAGLIDRITMIMLRKACRAARDWPSDMTVSVNMSPVVLRDSWIVTKTFAILRQEGLSPERLVIEVTENAVHGDMEFAREAVDAFRHAGIRVALDDFGSGHSSLSTLRELHFDHIKLDASFVRTIEEGDSLKITTAVAGLASAMGVEVNAEGVESRKGADILAALGFESGQGYLYGRPVEENEARRIARCGIGPLIYSEVA